MCASIESYANDRALDEAIIMGISFCASKDALIEKAIEQFPNISKDIVISRITVLWDQKKN